MKIDHSTDFLIPKCFYIRFPECRVLLQCLEDLAKRYPATKFVKIISTECIPNYPDRNLPTILVYNNSAVKATHVGTHSFGRRCTSESMSSLTVLWDTGLCLTC